MITKLTPEDTGVFVSSWWGQYGAAQAVLTAAEFGYPDTSVRDLASRKLNEMYPETGPGLSDDEHWELYDASSEVEEWLNEHVAPEGYAFGWHEGEFVLWSDEDWEQASW